jgi:hypothetical protein
MATGWRWLAVVTLCMACVQCGSQTPATPTSVTPPPDTSTPPVTDPRPESPPPAGGAEVFVGAGDIATCEMNSEATARLLDSIGGTVFTLGDHAYPRGAVAEFRDCYEPTWGRHKARTRPSPGNHDYESGSDTYFSYFGANAGPHGLGYYEYQLGSWHVLALNSNTSLPAQVTWLKNVLERNRSRCTIAYWHHPLYSSGPSAKVSGIRDWWEVLYEFGADVVLSSHDHLYERFAPQDDRGRFDAERGIRQFIAGTGGAPPHVARDRMPNSELIISTFGVLKLTLLADGYEWQFVPVSGPGDSGSGRCH